MAGSVFGRIAGREAAAHAHDVGRPRRGDRKGVSAPIVLLGCGDVGPIHGPVGAYADAGQGRRSPRPTCASPVRARLLRRAASSRRARATATAGSIPRMASIFGRLRIRRRRRWRAITRWTGAPRRCSTPSTCCGSSASRPWAPAPISPRRARLPSSSATASASHFSRTARCCAKAMRPGRPARRRATARAHALRGRRVPARHAAAHRHRCLMRKISPRLVDDVRAARDPRRRRGRVAALGAALHSARDRRIPAASSPTPRSTPAPTSCSAIMRTCRRRSAMRDGKACFYSLSNFIMSAPRASEERHAIFAERYGVALDPDYPNLPYGVDAKRSLIAKAVLGTRGRRARVVPAGADRPRAAARSAARARSALRRRGALHGVGFAGHDASLHGRRRRSRARRRPRAPIAADATRNATRTHGDSTVDQADQAPHDRRAAQARTGACARLAQRERLSGDPRGHRARRAEARAARDGARDRREARR